jgi:hypothetical protein
VIRSGWKEISNYLRFGVRTLPRWEHNGLPVKRVIKSPRSPVVADSDKLDAWIFDRAKRAGDSPKFAENRQRARELRHQAQEIRKEVLARLDVVKKTVAELRAKASRGKKAGLKRRSVSLSTKARPSPCPAERLHCFF